MRGETFVFLLVLGAFFALEAALAQSADPRCANTHQACGTDLSRNCLLRLGAGAEALNGGGGEDCSDQLGRYRACLADIVERCAPEPAVDADAPSPRKQLTALGRAYTLDDYLAAADEEDWSALDLYHEAGFLQSAKRACNVVDFVFRGRVSGQTERIAKALPKAVAFGKGCRGYIAQNRIKPLDAERLDLTSAEGGPAYLLAAACLFGNAKLNRNCGLSDLPGKLVKRSDLRKIVAPRRKAIERTVAALKDPSQRLEICAAIMRGETGRKRTPLLELSAASGRIGVGSSNVFGSTRSMGRYGFKPERYCREGVGEKAYLRALANLQRAEERLDQFVALGG